MVHILNQHASVVNQYLAEIRDQQIQQDPLRFRTNLERIGNCMAFEISKSFHYQSREVETPLGIARVEVPAVRVVLATILRAGLPFHQGLLRMFDKAGNAFISAYRKHHRDGSFEIKMEYVSCPDLDGSVLIVCDPMLATGASLDVAIKALLENGTPAQLHIATIIASSDGLNSVRRMFPQAQVWVAAVDDELTAKSYIVPGLGDAGDLSFGEKLQE